MRHYNTTVSQTLSRGLALKGESTDEIDEVISPVYEIKPIIDFAGYSTRTTTGTGTVTTTPTTKDLYVTNVTLSLAGDVNANITQCEVYANVQGVAKTLAKISHCLGVAGGYGVSITFNNPVKVDRGVSVYHAVISAVGTFSSTAVVHGYYAETLAGSN